MNMRYEVKYQQLMLGLHAYRRSEIRLQYRDVHNIVSMLRRNEITCALYTVVISSVRHWPNQVLNLGSLPYPPPPVPSPPLEVGPLNPARGMGERSKLPQWGLGQSPSRRTIWCISGPKGTALVATVLWIFNK